MPIEVSANQALGIQLIKFEGVVAASEVLELARVHAGRPELLSLDAVHIIDESADTAALTPVVLDTLRLRYNHLLRALDLLVVRRSGWLCRTASVCRKVEHWLDGRHSHDGQGTEVCIAASFADLGALFSGDELAYVAAARDFERVAMIDHSAGLIRS